MSDEQNNQEQQDQNQEPSPADANKQYRESDLAKQTFAELKATRDELAALKKQREDAAEEKRLAELESKQEYTKILEEQKQQIQALKTAHAKERLQDQLDRALLEAGAGNSTFRHGAVLQFSGDSDDIEKYVKGLKDLEANAQFFGTAVKGNQLPQTGNPGTRSTEKSLQERLEDADPHAQQEALQRMINGQSV